MAEIRCIRRAKERFDAAWVVPEVAPVIRLIREDEPARIRCLRRSRSSRSFSFRTATASAAASDILLRNLYS